MSRAGRIRKAAGAEPPGEDRGARLRRAVLGLDDDASATAYVVLRYYQSGHQCFSAWSPDELRAFSSFNRKLGSLSWQQIFQSGGKGGHKQGLGYTPHDGRALPAAPFLAHLNDDISWCEMRVTQKARVHGFRAGNAFFLVFLDRNHEIFPN